MSRVNSIPAVVFILVSFPADAFAYLDPGTGSYIVQLAIGFLLGSLWAIKMGWHRIKAFLRKSFVRNGADKQQ